MRCSVSSDSTGGSGLVPQCAHHPHPVVGRPWPSPSAARCARVPSGRVLDPTAGPRGRAPRTPPGGPGIHPGADAAGAHPSYGGAVDVGQWTERIGAWVRSHGALVDAAWATLFVVLAFTTTAD